MISRFPVGSFAIQSIIMSATSQFSTKTHLMEVSSSPIPLVKWKTVKCYLKYYYYIIVFLVQAQNFFTSLGTKGSQMRIVQEAIETIKLNMRWMENNLNVLQSWL